MPTFGYGDGSSGGIFVSLSSSSSTNCISTRIRILLLIVIFLILFAHAAASPNTKTRRCGLTLDKHVKKLCTPEGATQACFPKGPEIGTPQKRSINTRGENQICFASVDGN